jgi:homoserine dehydrogenase
MMGIRDIEKIVHESKIIGKKVKLLCELLCTPGKPLMSVQPRMISLNDPFATINEGNMGIRFTFKNSQQIFISSQFLSPKQTAYAVLNDLIKTDHPNPKTTKTNARAKHPRTASHAKEAGYRARREIDIGRYR